LIRHARKKIYYALLLIKKGGLGIFLRQFWSRLYSSTSYLWLVKDLDSEGNYFSSPSSEIEYSLQLADPSGFRKKLLSNLNRERGQDIFEILRRISFYERGFDACYLALTDSGEVCHVAWLLSASHNDLIRTHYPSGMRELEEDEVLQENVFTFPPYRNKGIMTSITLDLTEIAKSRGFHRVLAYVDTKNGTSLRSFQRAGFRVHDEEQEFRRFFRIWKRKG